MRVDELYVVVLVGCSSTHSSPYLVPVPTTSLTRTTPAKQQSPIKRHALDVTDAPEPSDVKFENAEHGAPSRAARRLATAALQYLSLAAGFVLISMASATRFNEGALLGVDRANCDASCDYRGGPGGALSLTDAQRDVYRACASTRHEPGGAPCSPAEVVCYRCYCFEAISAGMLGCVRRLRLARHSIACVQLLCVQPHTPAYLKHPIICLSRPPATPPPAPRPPNSEAVYCADEAGLLALRYSGQGLNVLGILLVNLVLVRSSRWLTALERHHTRSAEARSLASKLFLAQFLNSAVSTVVANAHLPGLSRLVAGTRARALFFQGAYTDLTPGWYRAVGVPIVTSQFVATALRLAYAAAAWGAARWRAARWRRSCLTQEELVDALRGPAFELDTRYGEHLNVIFVAMLLSGGLPVAYLSAAAWFAAAYWSEKWELLKLSRRPVAYGGALSEAVTAIVPFAAALHLGLALWAFSFFGAPPSPLLAPGFARLVAAATKRLEPVWREASGLPPDLAARRLVSVPALHLLACLVIVVALLFLKLTLTAWVRALRRLLSLLGVTADAGDDRGGGPSGAPEFGVALRTQLLVGGDTYAIQAQPEYAAAFGRPDDAADGVGSKSGGGGGGKSGDGDEVVAEVALRETGKAPAAAPPAGSQQQTGLGSGPGDSGPRAPAAWGAESPRHNSGGGAQAVPPPPQPQPPRQPQPMTGVQRLRQARASQVVPLADEFLPASAAGASRRSATGAAAVAASGGGGRGAGGGRQQEQQRRHRTSSDSGSGSGGSSARKR